MTQTVNCRTKIMQLLQIFKEEAKYLRAGKLSDVATLMPSKTKAVSDVEDAFRSIANIETETQLKPYLQALHRMSQDNARLLQAALAGARAAKARLDGLQFSHGQVGTYDPAGQKHSLASDYVNTKKIV